MLQLRRASVLKNLILSAFLPFLLGLPAHADVLSLKRVLETELPQTTVTGSLVDFQKALERQVAVCLGQNLTETLNFGGRMVTRQKWCVDTSRKFLELAHQAPDFATLMAQARTRFEWYRSIGDTASGGDVKFTGYYFPHLDGANSQSTSYTCPLYAQPSDLVQVTEGGQTVWRRKLPDGSFSPYLTRQEIDVGHALQGRGLELAWVQDPLDAFIFQVQGAGAILLHQSDGSIRKSILNYAAGNGHSYVSLRRILAAHGVPPEFLTLQGMHVYFKLHPEELLPSLAQSPGYVFFAESTEGPYGVDNLLLTPGHSIAIDRSVLPIGAVALFDTQRPVAQPASVSSLDHSPSWIPYSSLALSQDVGGAIRTPGRVDIYFGENDEAEFAAGQMNQSGSLFFAVLP